MKIAVFFSMHSLGPHWSPTYQKHKHGVISGAKTGSGHSREQSQGNEAGLAHGGGRGGAGPWALGKPAVL